MPLVPLLPIFHRLNREHFAGTLANANQPKVLVKWSDGRLRNTAGLYRHVFNAIPEIVISKPLLVKLPQSALESTLCHEMIHAWIDLILGIQEGHGLNFLTRMQEINRSQNAFQVTVRHKFPVPLTPPKWVGICSSCGQSFFYKRRVKQAACRNCCNKFYGGKWNLNCLLQYQPLAMEE